jgi:branched-chain amino acid transport system ATP-binding protein
MTLQVKHVVKHFEGVHAVRGVSFTVQPGECVAMIGPNGAGKSTSFACIAGQHHLTSGEVHWNGKRVDGLVPAVRLKHGIARTFQVAQTFEALTVLQNVQLLTQAPRGLWAFDALAHTDSAGPMDLLERVGLQSQAGTSAQSLPYGAKKRLELALALAGLQYPPGAAKSFASAQPQLLLLDEPAAGLAASERADLMQLVKSLTQGRAGRPGAAVLYTEHNMDAVFGVADRVVVLIDGEIAAQGSPEAIAQDATVRKRYLGQWWSASGFAGQQDAVPEALAATANA